MSSRIPEAVNKQDNEEIMRKMNKSKSQQTIKNNKINMEKGMLVHCLIYAKPSRAWPLGTWDC